MELNTDQLRQGDVLLVYVAQTETAPRVIAHDEPCILAFGEATGHKHQILTKVIPQKPVFDASAERYIRLLKQGELSHDEHSIALLRPGTIEIGVQVEAGPHNMLRRVQD